jgi:hypothetical protein
MNQKHLPYPPQMRNADLLPSPPHFDPVDEAIRLVAAARASLEALRVYNAIDCARQEAAIACADAAIARARQEAAAACDPPGRASQDDDDAYDKYDGDDDEYDDEDYDEYNDGNDKYDDEDYDEYDDDGNDEYDNKYNKYDDNDEYDNNNNEYDNDYDE